MIVQRTKTYAVCPTCGADAGQVDHLLGQEIRTRWYCDHCGQAYSLQFRRNGDAEIAPLAERKSTTYDVLRLPPQAKPVYFVVEGMRFDPRDSQDGTGDSGYLDGKRFYYEEHSCPTNWLKPVMVYFDGDSDPHGLIEFVRTRNASDLPPDEPVSPNDHDDALVGLIELSEKPPLGSGHP